MGYLLKVVRVLASLAVVAVAVFFTLVAIGIFTALDAATAAYASSYIGLTC